MKNRRFDYRRSARTYAELAQGRMHATSNRKSRAERFETLAARTTLAVLGILSGWFRRAIGNPFSWLSPGRALFGHKQRDAMTPKEWLWHFMRQRNEEFANGFERPTPRGPAPMCNPYQRAQRQRSLERKRVGPNYAKLARKGKLDLLVHYRTTDARHNARVARDALTGVVA